MFITATNNEIILKKVGGTGCIFFLCLVFFYSIAISGYIPKELHIFAFIIIFIISSILNNQKKIIISSLSDNIIIQSYGFRLTEKFPFHHFNKVKIYPIKKSKFDIMIQGSRKKLLIGYSNKDIVKVRHLALEIAELMQIEFEDIETVSVYNTEMPILYNKGNLERQGMSLHLKLPRVIHWGYKLLVIGLILLNFFFTIPFLRGVAGILQIIIALSVISYFWWIMYIIFFGMWMTAGLFVSDVQTINFLSPIFIMPNSIFLLLFALLLYKKPLQLYIILTPKECKIYKIFFGKKYGEKILNMNTISRTQLNDCLSSYLNSMDYLKLENYILFTHKVEWLE